MRKISALIFSLILALSSVAQTPFVSSLPKKDKAQKARFDAQVEMTKGQEDTELVGLSLAILSRELGINYTGAMGYDSREKDNLVDADQPFRIASITKTFVAATLLRLEEQGKISIEDPISMYISEEHLALLKSDKYDPTQITIRSCLNHTSGLFDYAVVKDDYPEAIIADPQHFWTRTEQVAFAMKIGKPVGKPGTKYQYSDTGYVLLGEIIEKVTGKKLGHAMRSTLDYDKLGMTSTWLEVYESHPLESQRPVRRYFDVHDATDWSPSVDLHGGGGMISTSSDLAKFMLALFEGEIFEDPKTIERMLEKPDLKKKGDLDYRLGIYFRDFGEVSAYMHSGLWGSYLIYFPEYKTILAMNYTDATQSGSLRGIFQEIKNIKEASDD